MARYLNSDQIATKVAISSHQVIDAILPPTMALQADDSVCFCHGDLRPFLSRAKREGWKPSTELQKADLPPRVRAAVDQCRQLEKVVEFIDAQPDENGRSRESVLVSAKPLSQVEPGLVVISFESPPAPTVVQNAGSSFADALKPNDRLPDASQSEEPRRVKELERQLQDTRRSLRHSEARLQAIKRDLSVSHMQFETTNEELVCSNRQLENTTRELRDLNRRLEEKVEQLKDAHDDLVNFFASSEVATLFLDEALCIKRFTPIVEDVVELRSIDRGRHIGDFAHELLQNDLKADAGEVLQDHVPRWRNIRANSGRWYTRRVLPYRTASLDVEGVVVTFLDITELKRSEEALRESEARFREMADGLPQVVWVHGPDGEQELVNETFCRFFGVTREEMRGERWKELVHPDDLENYTHRFLACMAERRAFHAQARVRRHDGEWRWLESWGKPRFTGSGEFKGFIGSSTDVTEQKAIEAALRESEERFRTLADNIAQLAWMADASGHIFWFNQRWLDYTGTTLDEMQGLGWDGIPHPDYLQRVKEKYLDCIRQGIAWEDTFPMRSKDGSYRWFLSRAMPTRDREGQIVRWLGTNTDITEQLQVEQLLRESDQRKDEYLAMLGHELRNPLAAISAATELAKLSHNEDPRLQHAVSVLERQARHVTQIVDGLLEVSRIARGKIELERQTVDLTGVLATVLQDREPHFEKRGLQVERRLPEEPIWVAGDWVRLVQVFDNLLGNAIKFTQSSGRITVSATKEKGEALVRVADTGVGIREDMLSRIFEPFQQETQDVARAAGGLGLGLSLAKSLIQLHGGQIEARSAGAGKGAEFVVRIPLGEKRSDLVGASDKATFASRRVLLVEDNVDAADTLASLLELKGHAVQVARNASQALEMLEADRAIEKRWDLVLCDIGLPGMNGYDFARTVRGNENLASIPLVALTGYGQPEDRKRSMEAGFDEHLTKPLTVDALTRLLDGD